ncbi:Tetrahydroberberine oxidase [Linum grandiflorum]
MNTHLLVLLSSLALIIISVSSTSPASDQFIKCMTATTKSNVDGHRTSSWFPTIFTPNSSLFASIMDSRVQNMRFSNSTTKPILILTPTDEAEIQAAVICCRTQHLEIRIRSGGHDYEGLSYLSGRPYIILDLFNLNAVQVDVQAETAWVQTGAQLGELYYAIAKKTSGLAFPAGVCPTVGVGGHLGGGGFGTLVRKYGLAADNVVDAYIVDYRGSVMDRKAMGEDVFWAIRGGGAASFGIVLSWKVKLVRVPNKITYFTVSRTVEEGATELVHKWQQFAHDVHEDLFVRVLILNVNKKVKVSFQSLFLGTADILIPLMSKTFPELQLRAENCTEGSWVDSVLHFQGFKAGSPIEVLLDKTQMYKAKFKAKSDFVKDPIPESGLRGIWKLLSEEVEPVIVLEPLGGIMNEISESHTPFPHRKGNLYNAQYLVKWIDGGLEEEKKHLQWMTKLYSYMESYVTKSPRTAYLNYRDLDIGTNNINVSTNILTTSEEASVWGKKYFKDNFYKLSTIKSKFDPHNFFTNEQSIPLFRK